MKTNLRPGSKKAIERGCTCPAMDNEDMKGSGLAWINRKCPIHGSPKLTK